MRPRLVPHVAQAPQTCGSRDTDYKTEDGNSESHGGEDFRSHGSHSSLRQAFQSLPRAKHRLPPGLTMGYFLVSGWSGAGLPVVPQSAAAD